MGAKGTAGFQIHSAQKALSVHILGRTEPGGKTPFERNRLRAHIVASADGLRADFATFLWTHELANLRSGLETLSRTLHLEPLVFSPYERSIILSIRHEGEGRIGIDVTLEPPTRRLEEGQSSMRFSVTIDQTELPEVIAQLSQLMDAYPVEPMSR
jgi:hypothetical protein